MNTGPAVKVSYSTGEGDCITTELMAEVVRRLKIEVSADSASFPVVLSVDAPSNKNVIWQPIDSVSRIPVGGTKIYNSQLGQWVFQFTSTPPSQLRVINGFEQFSVDGTKDITIAPALPTVDFVPTFSLTTYNGTSYSLPIPASSDNVNIYVIGRSSNTFSISVTGVPAGGIGIIWSIVK